MDAITDSAMQVIVIMAASLHLWPRHDAHPSENTRTIRLSAAELDSLFTLRKCRSLLVPSRAEDIKNLWIYDIYI